MGILNFLRGGDLTARLRPVYHVSVSKSAAFALRANNNNRIAAAAKPEPRA
jgi:hypothetical protein